MTLNWYMLSDRQTVGDGDAEHGDRCYSGDTQARRRPRGSGPPPQPPPGRPARFA